MTKILFLDRFGELNYLDVTGAYLSKFQDMTRLVIGTQGWDMPRAEAEGYVRRLAQAQSDELIDLTCLGPAD